MHPLGILTGFGMPYFLLLWTKPNCKLNKRVSQIKSCPACRRPRIPHLLVEYPKQNIVANVLVANEIADKAALTVCTTAFTTFSPMVNNTAGIERQGSLNKASIKKNTPSATLVKLQIAFKRFVNG
jgi:hypothetical protein